MHCLTPPSRTTRWCSVLLFAMIMVGCGGGGGSSDSSTLLSSTNTAAGVPTTLFPGATTGTVNGPSIPISSPTNGATHVAVSTVGSDNTLLPKTISATFSEPMNPATLVSPAATFTVKETASGSSVAGQVSMEPTHTVATFTPAAALAPNTQYTATITTAATNTAGTALGNNYAWTFTTGSLVGQAPILLKTAVGFLVLGGTSIANISTTENPTRINGQLGIDPGNTTNVSGFSTSSPAGTGLVLSGGIQFGAVVSQAKADLVSALNEANARGYNQVSVGTVDLASFRVNGGSPGVYPPGLYSSVAALTLGVGNMTLDAQGDPDAVWVFKAGSQLIVGDTRQILLLNGAKARNVYWTLGSSAQIGDQVSFKGNILAQTSNTLGTATGIGTTVEGRVLSVSSLQLNFTTLNAPAL